MRFQNIKKEKKIYNILWNRKKYTLLDTTITLHLEGQTRCFTVLDRQTIELPKNKLDSKFTKSQQCSLEGSHVVLTEIDPEFWSRPNPFSTKTDYYRSTSHKNLQKQNNEHFFIQSLYAWLHLTNNNNNLTLPHIYRRNYCPTHIFKDTDQTGR